MVPALIVHIMNMNSPNEERQRSAIEGFYQGMQVIHGLRENYAAADIATQFMLAVIREAEDHRGPSMTSTESEPLFVADGDAAHWGSSSGMLGGSNWDPALASMIDFGNGEAEPEPDKGLSGGHSGGATDLDWLIEVEGSFG
jgi:hypothetical protein